MADAVQPMPDIRSRGMELFYVQLVFLVVSGVFVLTRAYVKIFMVKKVTLDDHLIFLAMLVYTAYGAVALHGVLNGATGKAIQELSLDAAAISLRAWYICEVLYSPLTLAIRASVCVVLLRLATKRLHIWIIWVNFGLISVVSVAFFFLLMFQCTPIGYFWRQLYGEDGFCIPSTIVPSAFYAHSIVSALSDWCLGLMPVAILWNVNINKRTKAIIAVLLSMGMVAGIAPIVRIPFIRHMDISIEFLYATIDVAMWSIMEPAFGIIAACLATFRPLFKNFGFGWTNSKHSRSNSKSTGGGSNSNSSSSGKRSSYVPWKVASGKQLSLDLSAATHHDARVGAEMGSPDGSEMELNKRPMRDDYYEATTPRSWDVERGVPMDLSLRQTQPLPQARMAGSNITVRTSVNVTSWTAEGDGRPASRSTEGDRSGALEHPDMPPPPPVSRAGFV